ncbi:MAG: hypothetical protein ACI31F_08670 [Muribaculaceae bacterium]
MTLSRFSPQVHSARYRLPQAPPSLHLDAIPVHSACPLSMPRHYRLWNSGSLRRFITDAAACRVTTGGGIPVCSAGSLGMPRYAAALHYAL